MRYFFTWSTSNFLCVTIAVCVGWFGLDYYHGDITAHFSPLYIAFLAIQSMLMYGLFNWMDDRASASDASLSGDDADV